MAGKAVTSAETRGVRWSLGVVAAGLVVEVLGLYDMTPGSFVVFAALGIPLVLAGLLIYALTVWRSMKTLE